MSRTGKLSSRIKQQAFCAAPLNKKQRRRLKEADARAYQLPGHDLPWKTWVSSTFPRVTSKPFAARHVRLWKWFDSLTPGIKPRPRVEPWPRGGAKSSSGELGVVWCGVKLTRRLVLIVSETQEQANKHVQSIATLFEEMGVGRAINTYGASKGWKCDQLRTANGFNVIAVGLDTAARGIRLDNFRPDLIIFDDIDGRHDTAATVKKKTDIITENLLPAGSADCAVLFLQNLIHANSIVSQLVDGTADFLLNLEVATVEPAVRGLVTKPEVQPDGRILHHIVKGVPTWLGQNLETCEAQINEWGLKAFLREAQHEVQITGGFFKADKMRVVTSSQVPKLLRICRAWDKAATEDDGDYSAGVKIALGDDGHFYVMHVERGQWSTDVRDGKIRSTAEDDGKKVVVRGPQDPGAAGKSDAEAFVRLLKGFPVRTETVSGAKEVRADPLSSQVNAGNVYMVEGTWNKDFRRELAEFPGAKHDDQVDAAADAFDELQNNNTSWALDPAAQNVLAKYYAGLSLDDDEENDS